MQSFIEIYDLDKVKKWNSLMATKVKKTLVKENLRLFEKAVRQGLMN